MINFETPIFRFMVVYKKDECESGKFVFADESTGASISITELVNNIYPPEYSSTPYTDINYLQDWNSFISLCLTRVLFHKDYYLETLSKKNSIPNLPHIFMNSDEAKHHIRSYSSIANASISLPFSQLQKDWSTVLTEAYSYIQYRESATEKSQHTPRIMRLKQMLGLSNFSCFALHCTLACKFDRGFERVFKDLQGNETIPVPTFGIVQTLYALAFPEENENRFPDSNSLENRLLFSFIQDYSLMHPINLRSTTFSYIMGKSSISPELLSCIIALPNISKSPLHLDKQLQEASIAYNLMVSNKKSQLCILGGASGSGKKLTLQWLMKTEDAQFILIDLDKLILNKLHFNSILDELLFLAIVEGKSLCFATKESENHIQEIFDRLREYNLGIFILTESIQHDSTPDGYLAHYIDYSSLDLGKSFDFWQLFSKDYEYSPEIDWMQIAARYTLTAGKIEATLRHANHMAKIQNSLITENMISEVILRENTKRLSAIADRINLVYTWDDLMLDERRKGALIQACNRIKHRYTVEIEWGGRFAYGNGVSILLYGPPGTGKTMAAQVVAKDLGLPLYRIDLSRIVSKYVGETAKNINKIFEEAKNSNVILFFDEADALFAQRTEVKSSNDRHANSESSYLLQKIEDYSGVSILASNLSNTIDDAFRRRINYMINIHMPDEEQSLAIWKKCIPANAPISKDVSFEYLAKNTKFSGSVIKAAAVQAAYFAAEENLPISMKHFALAIFLEARKLGMSEPDAFKRFLYY